MSPGRDRREPGLQLVEEEFLEAGKKRLAGDTARVAHARSMGAHAEKAADIPALEQAIVAARSRDVPSVIVIETDPVPGIGAGGWWDVAVPQSGGPDRLEKAREKYHADVATQRLFDRAHHRARPVGRVAFIEAGSFLGYWFFVSFNPGDKE